MRPYCEATTFTVILWREAGRDFFAGLVEGAAADDTVVAVELEAGVETEVAPLLPPHAATSTAKETVTIDARTTRGTIAELHDAG